MILSKCEDCNRPQHLTCCLMLCGVESSRTCNATSVLTLGCVMLRVMSVWQAHPWAVCGVLLAGVQVLCCVYPINCAAVIKQYHSCFMWCIERPESMHMSWLPRPWTPQCVTLVLEKSVWRPLVRLLYWAMTDCLHSYTSVKCQ